MADNKKTKVDFATALREAADKIAPAKEKKPSKREESLIVDVSGTPTTLFRGDMTDEAWADLKAKADAKAIRPLPPKTYTAADQGTPAEYQNPFPDRAATTGDAGPGMSVLGNVAEMATNAAPAKPAPLSLEEGLSFGSQFIDNTNKNIAAVPRALAGSSGVIVGNALEGAGQLVGSEGLQKRGAAMQGTGLDVLNPPPAPVEQPAPAGGMADLAQVPADVPAPLPAQAPVSGEFKTEVADPALAEQAKIAREQAMLDASNAKDTITAQGEVQQHLLETAAATERSMQAEIALNAHLAAQAQLDSANEARKFYNASSQLAQEARDAASTPTDPNRYWNNKDAGQKAMAVLAGALFGATGQGMNWLQRLDGLVENDMRAQQSDRASKVEGINTQARMLGEAGNRAMALGASEAQAHLIEKQAKLEGLKSYLDSMQLQVSSSEKKVQAAMMAQAVSAKISDLAKEGYTLGDLEATKKSHDNYLRAQMRVETFKANQSAGAGGKKISEAASGALAESASLLMEMRKLSEDFKDPMVSNPVLGKLGGLDPTGNSKASQYNLKRLSVLQDWGKTKEGGVLKDSDIKRYDNMLKKAGGGEGGRIVWQQILDEVQQKFVTRVGFLKASGYDTTGVEKAAAALFASDTLSTEKAAQ